MFVSLICLFHACTVFILTSPNGDCHMKFQLDANIVVYNVSNVCENDHCYRQVLRVYNSVINYTDIYEENCLFVFKTASSDNAVWHSGTIGSLDGVKLVLQDDGNWVKLVSNGSLIHNILKHRIIWTSGTSSSPTCGRGQVGTRVMLEDNCKPAIYTEHDSQPLWIARSNVSIFFQNKFECNFNTGSS
jgi:hypothetical protein